jgi:hypothetical protein
MKGNTMTSTSSPNGHPVSTLPIQPPVLSDILALLTDRDIHTSTILANRLVAKGVRERRCLHTYARLHYGEGTAFATLCRNAGAVCLAHEHGRDADGHTTRVFVWEERDTHLSLSLGPRTTHLTLLSLDPDFAASLLTQIDACLIAQEPRRVGTVTMLCADHGRLGLTELGTVHQAFQPTNYAPEIRAGFDFMVTNLAAATPNGRLYVLHGLPGTGKSYVLRGIIACTPAVYIYVPPSLAGQLTSPDLLPVLLQERDRQEEQTPICLIMEDADSSLVRRAMDNASVVGDLLNMSDGFLGELANLHIFATVNAKKTDMDPALLRPGRLGVYLEFLALSRPHAWNVFTTLCAEAQVEPCAPAYTRACEAFNALYERPHTPATLADVYALARQAGWSPPWHPRR